jgi:hypothetical protein
MSKEAVFTMKLEADLRADFIAEAQAADRPASQILRELMRDFVKQQRQARDYEAFLQQKVESARVSMQAGEGFSNADVEEIFASRTGAVDSKE